MGKKSLIMTQEGEKYIIREINGDINHNRKLNNFGVVTGEEIIVQKNNKSGVIIRVKDTKVVIGLGMAIKIIVEDTYKGGMED